MANDDMGWAPDEHPQALDYIADAEGEPMSAIITLQAGCVSGCYMYSKDILAALVDQAVIDSGVPKADIVEDLQESYSWCQQTGGCYEIILWQLESALG